MNFFIEDAFAQAGAGGGEAAFNIIFIVGMVVLFYLFLFRPQMKRQKEHQQMVASLAKGDEAVTQGGLLGRIVEVGDNFVLLEIAEKTQVKVQKHMIAAVMPKGTSKGL
jgi:preprotein translocase subunit YajC